VTRENEGALASVREAVTRTLINPLWLPIGGHAGA